MKKKGFTLIELLAVIVILSIITIITVTIISANLNNTKTTLSKLSMDNIVKAAHDYVTEEQVLWTKNGETETVCVLVGRLVDQGFFKNSNIKNLDKNLNDVVALTRDSTKTIIKEEYIDYKDINNSICSINNLPFTTLSVSGDNSYNSDWYKGNVTIFASFTDVKDNNYYSYTIKDEMDNIILNSTNKDITENGTIKIEELTTSGKYKLCLKVGNTNYESSDVCTDLIQLDDDKPTINGIENIQLIEGQNRDLKSLLNNLTFRDDMSGIDESSKQIVKNDNNIQTISNTNELSVGENTLQYLVRDIAGNETTETIVVNIKPTPNVTTSYFCNGKTEYYDVKEDGYYQIIGNGSVASRGGAGAYVNGIIYLTKGIRLEVNVGCSNGYNGGGSSGGENSYNGGGSTTVKLNNENIFVAAGGGGCKEKFNLTEEKDHSAGSSDWELQNGGVSDGKRGSLDSSSSYNYKEIGEDGVTGGGGGSSYYYSPGVKGGSYYGITIPTIPSISVYACGHGGANYLFSSFINTEMENGKNNGDGNLKIVHISDSNFANKFYYTENVTNYEVPSDGIYEIKIKGGQTTTSKGDSVSGAITLSKGEILEINIGDEYGTNNGNTIVKLKSTNEILLQAGGIISPSIVDGAINTSIKNDENSGGGEVSIINLGDTSNIEFFEYRGNKENYTVTRTGYYYLSSSGAQGMSGGKGGTSSGIIYLNKGDILELNIGGQNGYNGGGSGYQELNGGGASHIKKNGDYLLIGAGGGGGSDGATNTAGGTGTGKPSGACVSGATTCYNGISGVNGGGAGVTYYVYKVSMGNGSLSVPNTYAGYGGANFTASELINPEKKSGQNTGNGKIVIEYYGDSYE